MTEITERLSTALADRYRIERHLGEGGMATVYLAHDLKHDRPVAVKVLRPELAAVLGADRFIQEIKTTANLQHPHILPLFDSGEDDGFLYYVMPSIEGETLRDKLNRETQLGIEEAVRITTDIADALDYAHRHNVIHRDIKPENILLHDGRPMVADFGIALAVSAAAGGRMTETGMSLGTPHYMSPEQATAEKDLTNRSDIYSLGCVLYEMLTGEPPHTGASAQAIVMKIVTDEVRPIAELRKSVPPHVAAATAKTLEKLAADRFATAKEFAEALADPGFSHGGFASPMRDTGVWNRVSVGMAALVLLLTVVSMVGWFGRSPVEEAAVMHLSLDLDGIAPDLRSDIIISPDGSAFVMAGSVGGTRSLYIRRADEAHFRVIPDTENARYPLFSPDGKWIVFREGGGGSLRKVSVDGGASLTVLPFGVITGARPSHWADDGTILFRGDRGVFRVSEDGGPPELLLESSGLPPRFRLLPGGRGVLLTYRGTFATTSVSVLDLESDSLIVLLAEGVDPTYVETGHILFAHPNGGLFAVAFDADRLEITGQPFPLLDDLRVLGTQAHYSLSTNGTLVYGSGGNFAGTEQELLVVHLDGTIEPIPLALRTIRTPRWSSDGRSVAYYGGEPGSRNIFTYDVELATEPRQITFQGDNRFPVWSPDGSRIVFSSLRDDTNGWDLFVATVDDNAPEESILKLDGIQNPREWLSGDVVVFESGATNASTNLWRVGPSVGGAVLPYIEADADLDDVAVSPDGAWAAYQSDETSVEEIYVDSYPDPSRPVRVTEGGGQFPKWSPDGGTLYYWGAENLPVDTLYAAQVVTGLAFAVLSREVVLSGNYRPEDWDLHPEGDRIVVSRAVPVVQPGGEHDEEQFVVVLNFLEELKAKVGN